MALSKSMLTNTTMSGIRTSEFHDFHYRNDVAYITHVYSPQHMIPIKFTARSGS